MCHLIHKLKILSLAEEDATNTTKLFAINLVREAIGKILLPRTVISDSIDDPANSILQTRRAKNEEKSLSNLSHLKKWILLLKFVNELVNINKPRNPSYLPLKSDAESEKVYLRRKTVDERKRSEMWMLDYAFRQVVSTIRKVVGQLAPTQKRKVALLVKAFETIVPPQDDHSTQVSSWPHRKGERHESVFLASKVDTTADIKPEAEGKCMPKLDDHSTQVSWPQLEGEKHEGKGVPKFDVDVQLSNVNGHQAHGSIVPPQDDHSTQVSSWSRLKGEKHEYVFLASKVDTTVDIKPDTEGKGMTKFDVDVDAQLSNENGHQIHGSMANDAQFPEKSAEIAPSLHENVPLMEESQQQINNQKLCGLSTGNLLGDLEKRDEASSTIRSTTCDIDVKPEETELEQPEIAKENIEILAEEKRMKSEAIRINNVAEESLKTIGSSTLLQESTARNDRDTELKPERILSRESSLDSQGESQLDKENYIRMWRMTYQHVASNIASKVGSHLLEEEDKKVKYFDTSLDIGNSSPRVISDFNKSEAVKLIQEAINEILHDIQDDDTCDTQSVASETSQTTPDQDLYGKNRNEVWNNSSSNTSVLNEEYVREFHTSESRISIEETKSTLPKPKSWRKLKKLKESIKTMEKGMKLKSLISPRKNLPLPSDVEPEIVDSKHKMVNERKKAEQWTLDHGPADYLTASRRRRRVAMFVEAFEAVVPLPEI